VAQIDPEVRWCSPWLPSSIRRGEQHCLASFSFQSLAEYEQYRIKSLQDPECQAAFRFAKETNCFLSYERTFFRPLFE
jgi:hypothetical protein